MSGGWGAFAWEFGVLLVELVVLLFVVSAALTLAARRAGVARLQRWLGGSRMTGTLKGMGVGFFVPFCTYSAIPAFVGMVEARVRTATLAGFLLAAPVLDPLVLAMLMLLFGWQLTLAYTVVTAGAVFALALAADALAAERLLRPTRLRAATAVGGEALHAAAPDGADAACSSDPFGDQQPWRGLRAEGYLATTYAAGLVRRLAVPMVLAVAVAAGIVGFVPEELLSRLAGPHNALAVPVAAVLGVPFYVSAEAFLPIASALNASGMGIGATFALVISAAGVNVPELALLSRLLRAPLLAAYAAAVAGVAVAAGYLVPLLA
ncbi:MAG TPA: permease [Egibacteraceae bacterium]|nr:permease [Egibacteraceae bacterium]